MYIYIYIYIYIYLNTDRIQWTFSSKDSFVEFQNSYFPTFLSILVGHSEKRDRNAPTFLIIFKQQLYRVHSRKIFQSRGKFDVELQYYSVDLLLK